MENNPLSVGSAQGPVKTTPGPLDSRPVSLPKRIGWFGLFVLLPVIFLLVQVAVIAFASVAASVSGGVVSVEHASDVARAINLPFCMALSQVITIAIMVPWWLAVSRSSWSLAKQKNGAPMGVRNGIGIIMLGVGIQFALGVVLTLASLALPDVFAEYSQMMKTMGIGALDPLNIAATAVLAPVVEEVLFRGLCFLFAWRATGKVWAALVLQALAFALVHGNIVQGSYAFVLGIVLGMVYLRYRKLWPCILLHFCVNSVGVAVTLLPASVPMEPYMAATAVLAVVLVVLGWRMSKLSGAIGGRDEQ